VRRVFLLVEWEHGRGESTAAGRVTEDIGAVDVLVDAADGRQGAHGVVGEAGEQLDGQAFGVQDAEWPVVEGAGARVDRRGEPEGVVQRRDGLVGGREMTFTAGAKWSRSRRR